MKILMTDIETAPNVAYVWRFFKENISASQVLEHCEILSVAAKWLEEKEVFCWAGDEYSECDILLNLNELLDEADMVVGHNLDRFDAPKIRGRSLVYGLDLPSPYKQIDTCAIARREFGFESNSLEYLCNVLGCTPKQKHTEFPGFELWLECLRDNPKAWKVMKKYNIADIVSLEELYLAIRPYDKRHPSVSVLDTVDAVLCPRCGSAHNQKRGQRTTLSGVYQQYQCQECGGWHSGRYTENHIDQRRLITRPI